MAIYVNLKHSFDEISTGDRTFGPYESAQINTVSGPATIIEGVRGAITCACATFDETSKLWAMGQPHAGGGRPEFRYLRLSQTPDREPEPQGPDVG